MLARIHHLGGSLVFIQPVNPLDPGFGNGAGPVDPGYGGGHPGMPHPGHELPHLPGIPDNSLPTNPPPMVPAGSTLVLARTPDGKWHWATVPATTIPMPLPVPPPTAAPKI